MEYYQDLITQKSWQTLKNLKKQIDFVLIGGWAVWLLTRNLKSKDIDIIVDYSTLANLKKIFEISKNERLKKYEGKVEGIDIDIYLPYYSNPGLPAEIVQKYVIFKEGFRIPKPEILLVLKQAVYEERKASIKGQKDKIDIISLLTLPLDFSFYQRVLEQTNQEYLIQRLKDFLKITTRVRELDFGDHQIAKLKGKVLSKI